MWARKISWGKGSAGGEFLPSENRVRPSDEKKTETDAGGSGGEAMGSHENALETIYRIKEINFNNPPPSAPARAISYRSGKKLTLGGGHQSNYLKTRKELLFG